MASQGWYPFIGITITRDGLTVGSPLKADRYSLARSDVSAVCLVPDGHRPSLRSVAFELVDGSLWEVLLGPPRILDDLESLGWPVDRDRLIT